jgi:hypothetical protein
MGEGMTPKLDVLLVRGAREISAVATCRYTPPRPAPHCSNPDHPSYSDPGDPEDLDVLELHCADCGSTLDLELTEDEMGELMSAAERWLAEQPSEAEMRADYMESRRDDY